MIKQHSSQKGKRERRVFPDELKAKVVELVRRGERPVGEICRELDLTDSAVRSWVKQADGGRLDRPSASHALLAASGRLH